MKKVLFILAIFILAVQSSVAFEVDGIYYAVRPQDPSTVKVCKGDYSGPRYGSSSGDIKIPNTVTYKGKSFRVVEYEKEAFAGRNCRIFRLYLSSSITTIPSDLFSYSNVEQVIIPEGVTIIDEKAFQNSNVYSVIIPNSVKEIRDYAFSGCEKLRNLFVGPNVTYLGWAQYAYTIWITSSDKVLTIPGSSDPSYSVLHASDIWLNRPLRNNKPGPVFFKPTDQMIVGPYATNYGISNGRYNEGPDKGPSKVVFLTETPPQNTKTRFYLNRNFCSIYVPYNCLEQYSIAPYWQTLKLKAMDNPCNVDYNGFDIPNEFEELLYRCSNMKYNIHK